MERSRPRGPSRLRTALLVGLGALLAACQHTAPSSTPTGDAIVVAIEPATAQLAPGQSQSFTATVTGTDDNTVTWTATCGTTEGDGASITYTAPADVGTCELTATSTAEPSATATATITVTGTLGVAITSHTDGERIFGSRTIALTGTASNVTEVEVLLGGSLVATVDVVSGAFEAEVTLADNANTLRVQTTDALLGDDVELVYPWVNATTFRPMDVVIGQADTASNAAGISATQLGPNTHAKPVFVGGILYVPDAFNNRVLGYFGLPTDDGAAADFVLGQPSFTTNNPGDAEAGGGTTARTLYCPTAVASDGARLFVADACHSRILIYNALPTTSYAPADVVVGQATMSALESTTCSFDAPFGYVTRVAVGGGRLVVPDSTGNRVLVWNSIPTENGTEPDLVLGQPRAGATCVANDDDQDGVEGQPTARTLHAPWDAWTDGDRLLVADRNNHRVLLWETFPTTDFAPADVVIGQASMTTGAPGFSAAGFGAANTVASNGNQILIADYDKNRVLVYDAFPSTNGAAANAVLGQSTFRNVTANDDDQNSIEDDTPSARTLGRPFGAWMGEGVMVVNDFGNNRYALFVD